MRTAFQIVVLLYAVKNQAMAIAKTAARRQQMANLKCQRAHNGAQYIVSECQQRPTTKEKKRNERKCREKEGARAKPTKKKKKKRDELWYKSAKQSPARKMNERNWLECQKNIIYCFLFVHRAHLASPFNCCTFCTRFSFFLYSVFFFVLSLFLFPSVSIDCCSVCFSLACCLLNEHIDRFSCMFFDEENEKKKRKKRIEHRNHVFGKNEKEKRTKRVN